MANDPMEQFQIKEKAELFEIAGQTISWTNSSFWMVISVILIIGFFALTTKRKLVPCLLYTSPSPRDQRGSRMPSSA